VDDAELLHLAAKVVKNLLPGGLPNGVTRADAKQDAVCVLLELAQKPETPGVPRDAWLVVKTRGILRDRYGRLFREAKSTPLTTLEGRAVPCVDPESLTLSLDVREAISRLPEKQKFVILATMRGETQLQIAEGMGVGQSYVSQLLKAARASMKDLLGEDYE
jgi:RNA polymerase sigma factor (sigma-70 family)